MVPGVIVSSLNLVVFDPSPPDAVLEEMAALDRSAVAEFGREYAAEPWSVESFARRFPHKWTLSRCCVESRAGKILGFWIASMAVAGIVHTHRVAIKAGMRGQGLGQRLFEEVRKAAWDEGGREMTLFVAPSNEPARRFYERLGFRPLAGSELHEMMRRTGRPGAVDGNVVRIGGEALEMWWREVGENKL